MQSQQDLFSRRVYVIGEVVISLVVLIGAGLLLYQSREPSVQNAASVGLGAVLAFWFQRRQGEQAVNAVSVIADGKLGTIADRQTSLEQSVNAHIALQTAVAMEQAKVAQQS